MEKIARVPEDPPQWEAIDIFVFSNGQQNSPPRKYHLRIDDLSWWTATLKYLGRQQFGPTTSVIDLYTIEGKKIQGPLELSHGTFYVAVEQSKDFVDAGYEKYLIKASRSWEKRQAQRDNAEKPSENLKRSEKEQDLQLGEQKIKTQDESMLLNTIISSVVENESSVVVSPLAVPNSEKKPEAQSNVTTVKSVEKKRISIQRPAFIKKIPPNLPNQPLVSNIKPQFKRSGLKPANVTISKPENDRGIKTTKVPIRSKFYKPLNTPKQPPIAEVVVSSAHKEVDGMKTTSSIKIGDKNNQNVLTKAAEISKAVEDKDVVVVSNIYKNPQKESPSITVDAVGPAILNPELTRNEPRVDAMLNLNMVQPYEATDDHSRQENKLTETDIELPNEMPRLSILKHEFDNSRLSENPNHILISEEPPLSKSKANCNIILGDSSSPRVTKDSNKMENAFKIIEPRSQENVIRTQIYNNNYQPNSYKIDELIGNRNDILQNSSIPRVSIAANELDNVNNPKYQENPFNVVTEQYNIDDDNENFKSKENPSKKYPNLTFSQLERNDKQEGRYPDVNDSKNILITETKVHRVSSVLHSNVSEQIINEREIHQTIQNNLNIDDVQITSLMTNNGNKLCDSKHPNEKYMTILNKGDTVNLKLSIEIKKDDNSITNKNDVKSDTSPKEKSSQIDCLSNNIVEHKSLLSLIIQEVEKDQQEGKQSVIMVHCKRCKYCKDPTTNTDTISINKNEIQPPKSRESSDIKVSEMYREDRNSIVNPVKAVISCMSIERLEKVSVVSFSKETSPNHIRNLNDPDIENIRCDKEAFTRKSIIIENVLANKESKANEIIKVDCATQTDWRDILLEVKQENDGHYTFCLPSLGTLKYFKLL